MHENGSRTLISEAVLLPAIEDRLGTAVELSFGGYLALPFARTLLLDGSPVCIGARAFDLLVLLLARKGTVVCKDEIMSHVWPTTTVDESNLRFQITSLRKALGEERDRIKTVTGRGYLFAADQVDATHPPHKGGTQQPLGASKPAIVIIDQDAEIRDALQRLLRPFDAYVQAFVSVEAFVASGSRVSTSILTA